MSHLKTYVRALGLLLCGSPLLWVLPGCDFRPSGAAYTAHPRSGVVHCDVVKERRCSTVMDRAVGIDIARPNEEGFWVGRSSEIGLDKSPAAMASCGGQPAAIVFRCAFPDGCPVCVNCGTIGSGQHYQSSTEVCPDFCLVQRWGNGAECQANATASNGQPATCFAGACTDNGTLRTDWVDPRRITPTPTPTATPTPQPVVPVVWDPGTLINVTVEGMPPNGLRKTAGTHGIWDAGAASSQLLMSGNGYVEFTVTETNTARMCGLSIGGLPDSDPSYTDIDFAVYTQDNGRLSVYESGVEVPLTDAIGPIPYSTGDRIRVSVRGSAVKRIEYSLNGTRFHTSTRMVAYPLRADASLWSLGATITNARVSF